MLYKKGAKRDLSNVAAGFDARQDERGGHFVSIIPQVTKPDGKTDGFESAFAQI